ncbi:hypothetical protein SLA2020_381120 [Shorea laevis]
MPMGWVHIGKLGPEILGPFETRGGPAEGDDDIPPPHPVDLPLVIADGNVPDPAGPLGHPAKIRRHLVDPLRQPNGRRRIEALGDCVRPIRQRHVTRLGRLLSRHGRIGMEGMVGGLDKLAVPDHLSPEILSSGSRSPFQWLLPWYSRHLLPRLFLGEYSPVFDRSRWSRLRCRGDISSAAFISGHINLAMAKLSPSRGPFPLISIDPLLTSLRTGCRSTGADVWRSFSRLARCNRVISVDVSGRFGSCDKEEEDRVNGFNGDIWHLKLLCLV